MNVLHRVKNKLDALDFDFSHFTLAAFADHVGVKLGRRIEFIPLLMPAGVYAAWIRDRELPLDYIFFNPNLPSLLLEHSQLHELGHLICQHQTLLIGTAELDRLMQQGDPAGALCRSQKVKSDLEEQEAETLAAWVQVRAQLSQPALAVASSSQAGQTCLNTFFQPQTDERL